MQKVVVTKQTPNLGRVVLEGYTLKVFERNRSSGTVEIEEERELISEADRDAALQEHFGIHVPKYVTQQQVLIGTAT